MDAAKLKSFWGTMRKATERCARSFMMITLFPVIFRNITGFLYIVLSLL
jgi:hypothetical protein